jgi:hypothetical protein
LIESVPKLSEGIVGRFGTFPGSCPQATPTVRKHNKLNSSTLLKAVVILVTLL